jgi:hypothetical protein
MPHPSRTFSFLLATSAFCLWAVTASGTSRPGPQPGRGDSDPCGTWHVLSPGEGDPHQVAQVRPPTGTFKVFSSHFVVHYYGDSLTTYAQSVSDAAEYTYRVLVDTLQHLPPLPDGANGGDARTDIYLRPYTVMGSAYGTTYPETNTGSPYTNSFTAWVELVDTMGTTRRLPITAHEVYHTIQVVYDRYESSSLLEMFSTWVQDRTYPDANVHWPTTRLFFRQPQRGLFLQTYSNVPWAFYLTQKYGDGIMQNTLLECAATQGPNPREAFDAVLAGHGSNFLDTFIDFGTFNYWAGGRDDGQHYKEGKHYYTTTVERRVSCYPETLFVSVHPPAELGANYAFLDGDSHSGPLKVAVYPEFLSSTMLTMTRFKGGVGTRTTSFYPQFSVPVDSFTVSDWAQCDSILLVYQVNQSNGAENSFAFSAKRPLATTPAAPWLLVLDRDGCRAPFDGVQDDYTYRDGEEQPFADALRNLGATVRVEDGLPPDLTDCRGIFLVGGYDAGAGVVTLDDAMLARLNTFMDNGGDIYVEGSRLGEYMDPSLGAGNATQQSFWSRFSCTFAPGNPFGNLLQWSTSGSPFVTLHQFSYDNGGSPNTYNGVLTPTGNAAYLVRDGGLKVRATAVRAMSGGSTRIMSTIVLGGSNGLSGDTRESFLGDVLAMFDNNLAALAVSRATVNVDLRHVAISGVLEHYASESLALARIDAKGSHDVPVQVTRVGGEWRFSARDNLETASARYQLSDVAEGRVLWQQTVSERTPDYTLRVTGIYPTPARDSARIAVESPGAAKASLAVYDVAGREVSREATTLRRGSNVLFLRSLPSTSGVYFVHIAVPGGDARGRLLVIR